MERSCVEGKMFVMPCNHSMRAQKGASLRKYNHIDTCISANLKFLFVPQWL